ncbi:CpaF family protein [archaeon]|nr:CpaF family protein [archaeon]MBL7057039.1 CpaF family protein [Candidatus Woesearchaeota archaeon]
MTEAPIPPKREIKEDEIDRYSININDIIVEIRIVAQEDKPVPQYIASITNISETTRLILEKIRQEFVSRIDVEEMQKFDDKSSTDIRTRFQNEIRKLISKYFPKTDDKTMNMLINYLIEENLGLGKIEILLRDSNLEELVINNHVEPVWVYHRKHGWCSTNVKIPTEARIRHYATMIGRDVGKEITTLNPLMDAHLSTGDRVNATLMPISTKGNTITIRKFAADPWTITKFIKAGTISLEAAAFLWVGIQNELSILVAGGTGSGKTSTLNAVSNFFPPNQRIISIEDTRELTLASNLHWVPMETRLPNPEGKGGVSMLDLVINSLRMRPDRIIVGEIRRQKEAEVLLEAAITGHSVYGTFHANNAEEVVMRMSNPPIGIPKQMLTALGLILVQNRNRRTGKRRTLQIAEITTSGDANVIMQMNAKKDVLERINDSKQTLDTLELYTGMNRDEIEFDLKQKMQILRWMIKKNIEEVDEVGDVMAKYYLGRLKLD